MMNDELEDGGDLYSGQLNYPYNFENELGPFTSDSMMDQFLDQENVIPRETDEVNMFLNPTNDHGYQQTQNPPSDIVNQQRIMMPDLDLPPEIQDMPIETMVPTVLEDTRIPAPPEHMPDPVPEEEPERDLQGIRKAAEEIIFQTWSNVEPPVALISKARKGLQPLCLNASDPDQDFDPEAEEVFMTTMMEFAASGGTRKNGRTAKAVSSRMMSYVRCCIAERLISQRIALRVLVRSPIFKDSSEHSLLLRRDFAMLLSEILPWYDVCGKSSDTVREECVDFLSAIKILLHQSIQINSLICEALRALALPRVIALARCAGRRVPGSWSETLAAIKEVEDNPNASARLKASLAKYEEGLSSSFDHPDYSRLIGRRSYDPALSFSGASGIPWQNLLRTARRILGQDVVDLLYAMWHEQEPDHSDFHTLEDLEQRANNIMRPGSSLPEKVRMCELLVHNVAITASSPEGQQRKLAWGGMQRLLRLIRDAVPQAKAHLSQEFPSLIVACAVVGCCAVVLGTGHGEIFEQERDDAVECALGLRGFAIGHLEEVLAADDTQEWKPFGAWLLLLASRCGNLLQSSPDDSSGPAGNEHVRAAKALRDWSLFGGTATGSAHFGSNSNTTTESASTLVMESAMRVIDVSDLTGSDETLIELCSDLIV